MNNTTTQTPTFENRVRFNWSYHDGASSRNAGTSRDRNYIGTKMDSSHYDLVYVAGFQHGYDDAASGTYAANSDAAWQRSGLKNGNSYRPHALTGKDTKGRKIAPWMCAA